MLQALAAPQDVIVRLSRDTRGCGTLIRYLHVSRSRVYTISIVDGHCNPDRILKSAEKVDTNLSWVKRQALRPVLPKAHRENRTFEILWRFQVYQNASIILYTVINRGRMWERVSNARRYSAVPEESTPINESAAAELFVYDGINDRKCGL